MTTCKAKRYSDQMICDACGLQWDINDIDPPECNPVKISARKAVDAKKQIADIRSRLFNKG